MEGGFSEWRGRGLVRWRVFPQRQSTLVSLLFCLPEIMDGDLGVLTDYFILVIYVGCGKVYQDIDDEHYVN